MKILIALIALLMSFIVNAQVLTAKDSLNTAFKAKLLTVSVTGIAERDMILKDVESQHVSFLKTSFKNFLFLQVQYSQPYRLNQNISIQFVHCSYFIAFNIKQFEFYRIGGFDSDDIDKFMEDLWNQESVELFLETEPIKEVDFNCLSEYSRLSKKKRLKKKLSCFKCCSEEIFKDAVIFH